MRHCRASLRGRSDGGLPNQQRRLLETTQRRLLQLEDHRSTIDRLSEMDDVDESVAGRVWDRWRQEHMSELEVVFMESLRTGLLRLLILSVVTTGSLQPGEVARHWTRLIQEADVRT